MNLKILKEILYDSNSSNRKKIPLDRKLGKGPRLVVTD